MFIVLAGLAGWTAGKALYFNRVKWEVLNADKEALSGLGRHFVVGWTDDEEIRRLAAMGAIGGVYITSRNIRGKSFAEIKSEIRALQEIRKSNGLPPLFIAADQEGGLVSRLSPPLTRLPPLSFYSDRGNVASIAARYGSAQAEGLARLGVNLNFSPVVDLKIGNAAHAANRFTRIDQRAISHDRDIVTAAALAYSQALEAHGVFPTLKHFPGLGRVAEDTHLQPGRLEASPDFLKANDWLPFMEITRKTGAFIMVGHVILGRIDPENPASSSSAVIQGVIRNGWGHEGVLITDDLTMGAVVRSKSGVEGAAVKSLNAGVDLLLISKDCDRYYSVMLAALEAREAEKLDPSILAKSDARIEKTTQKLHLAPL